MNSVIPNEIFDEQREALLISDWEEKITSHQLSNEMRQFSQETWAHQLGVTKLVGGITLRSEAARDLDETVIEDYFYAGAFHDIGKMSESRHLLNKRLLSPADWQKMRLHPIRSFYAIEEHFPNKPLSAMLALRHHQTQKITYPSTETVERLEAGSRKYQEIDRFALHLGILVVSIADKTEAMMPLGKLNSHNYKPRNQSIVEVINEIKEEVIGSRSVKVVGEKNTNDILNVAGFLIRQTVLHHQGNDMVVSLKNRSLETVVTAPLFDRAVISA